MDKTAKRPGYVKFLTGWALVFGLYFSLFVFGISTAFGISGTVAITTDAVITVISLLVALGSWKGVKLSWYLLLLIGALSLPAVLGILVLYALFRVDVKQWFGISHKLSSEVDGRPNLRFFGLIILAGLILPLASILSLASSFGWFDTIFNVPNSNLGHYCSPYNPTLNNPCLNMSLSAQGKLNFTLNHSNSGTLTQVAFACATQANTNTNRFPQAPTANLWMRANSSGRLYYSNLKVDDASSLSVKPYTFQTFTGLACYNAAGSPLGNISKGTIYNGYVWMAEWSVGANDTPSAIPFVIATISVNAT